MACNDPVFVPSAPDIRLKALLAEYPAELFTDPVYHSCELMDRYGLGWAIQLVNQLELGKQLARPISIDGLIKRLDFNPRFGIALTWLLERLASAGLVAKSRDEEQPTYQLTNSLPEPRLGELREIGLGIDPANMATLSLLDAACAVYPAVASGAKSGEEALFNAAQLQLWLDYFSNDNLIYAFNNRISAVAIARRLSEFPSIRILEVGAGAGSATAALLERLAQTGLNDRIERYLVTEPNPFFRRRGERNLKASYRDIPLEYSSLDIDKPWLEQGVPEAHFDLIYGVNSMHVAHDLLFSLDQARKSVKSDGWVVMGECLRPFPGQPIWAELVFQIMESFINVHTDEDYRPNPGFLTADQWLHALERSGFRHIEVTPEQEAVRAIYPRFFTGAVCAKGV